MKHIYQIFFVFVFSLLFATSIASAQTDHTPFLIVNMEIEISNTGSAEYIVKSLQAQGYKSSYLHWSQVDSSTINQFNPPGIFLSGQKDPWDFYSPELDKFKMTIRETEFPVVGFCGGHQFLALAFEGGKVDRIKRLKPGIGYEGCFRETGFVPVTILIDDVALGKKGDIISVYQAHYDEVKTPPNDFEIIASNDLCKVQAMRHVTKPIYGTQFHPEAYDVENSDGKAILKRFIEFMLSYKPNLKTEKNMDDKNERKIS